MKNLHDKHQTSQDGAIMPDASAAACRTLNDAEKHLASQAGIPDVLRNALLQAEANWRMKPGHVMPVATVQPNRQLVKVPDGCEGQRLFEFLWYALLRSNGHSIQFAYPAEDDGLWVIYMDRDRVGYVASAPACRPGGALQLGDWTVKAMPRSDEAGSL